MAKIDGVIGNLEPQDKWKTSYYVRDASGNTMAIYEVHGTDNTGGNYTEKWSCCMARIEGVIF